MINRILTLLLVLLTTTGYAQDHQEYGWHIIEPGSKYSIMLMSSSDMSVYLQSRTSTMQGASLETIEADARQYQATLPMMQGEVVFVTDHFKDKYIGFDPMGRMIAFQGEGSLTKAPMVPGAGVGHLQEDIQLLSGDVLNKGSFIWIVAQDLAKSTVTVLVSGGVRHEIPQAKISLLAAEQRRSVNESTFIPVR